MIGSRSQSSGTLVTGRHWSKRPIDQFVNRRLQVRFLSGAYSAARKCPPKPSGNGPPSRPPMRPHEPPRSKPPTTTFLKFDHLITLITCE